MIMVAPVFSASMVLPRVRILVSVTLTLILVPLIPPPPPVNLLSVEGGLITMQQLLIGIVITHERHALTQLPATARPVELPTGETTISATNLLRRQAIDP